MWGQPNRAVVMEDFAVADSHRKQFLWMWSEAEIPSIQSNTIQGERLAEGIIKRYGGRVSYITSKDKSLFRTFREADANPGYVRKPLDCLGLRRSSLQSLVIECTGLYTKYKAFLKLTSTHPPIHCLFTRTLF